MNSNRLFSTFIILLCFHALQAQVKILFDATKAQTAANGDWQIDADLFNLSYPGGIPNPLGTGNEANPQRYPTPDQSTVTANTPDNYWKGALSSYAIECVKKGYRVETLPYNGSITYGNTTNPQDLTNYKVFVICEPNIKFTANEIDAIYKFVNAGGGLMMIGNHKGSDRNNDGYDPPVIWNELLGADHKFGFAYDFNSISEISTNVANASTSTPFLNGDYGNVTAMQYSAGATMRIFPTKNPKVKAHVFTKNVMQKDTSILALSSEYGLGRIFAVGDSSVPDDGDGDTNDVLYDGWLEDVDGNHRRLIMNATVWLAENIITPISITKTTTDVSCNGQSNGEININTTGGNGTFEYQWSSGDNTCCPKNLSAGSYFVTITSGPLTKLDTLIIKEPDVLNVTLSSETLTCSKPNICLRPIIYGGTLPYTLMWQNGTASDSLCVTEGGEVILNIVDKNLCSLTTKVNVNEDKQSPNIEIIGDSTINCKLKTITLLVRTSASSTSFEWMDENAMVTMDSIIMINSPGNFTAKVTNNVNGCINMLEKIITEDIVAPVGEIIGDSLISCNNATINLSTTADTMMSVSWYNNAGLIISQSRDLTLSAGGTYFVSIQNPQNGCVTIDSFTLYENLVQPEFVIDSIRRPTDNLSNGYVSLGIINSLPISSYEWVNAQGVIVSTSSELVNVPAGQYICKITATNGCEATVNIFLEALSKTIDENEMSVTISPNPAIDFIKLSFSSPQEIIEIKVYNSIGNEVIQTTLDHTMTLDINHLSPGVYILMAYSSRNQSSRLFIVK